MGELVPNEEFERVRTERRSDSLKAKPEDGAEFFTFETQDARKARVDREFLDKVAQHFGLPPGSSAEVITGAQKRRAFGLPITASEEELRAAIDAHKKKTKETFGDDDD